MKAREVAAGLSISTLLLVLLGYKADEAIAIAAMIAWVMIAQYCIADFLKERRKRDDRSNGDGDEARKRGIASGSARRNKKEAC